MTDDKKYQLMKDDKISHAGEILYRIQAVRDFTLPNGGSISEGDLGGYVASEDNLSHEGYCWIFPNAKVYGEAEIQRGAVVYGNAEVFGNARILGSAQIFGNAKVSGWGMVKGTAWVHDQAQVAGTARIQDDADIFVNAIIEGNATIGGDTRVEGNARISGGALIWAGTIRGNAKISLDGGIQYAKIEGDAQIKRRGDLLTIGQIGSRFDTLSVYKTSRPGVLLLTTGCFKGTLDEFERAVDIAHGEDEYHGIYYTAIDLIRKYFEGYLIKEDPDEDV